MPQALQLLDNNNSVDCVKFGSTYYGTDKVQMYWLYNASPKRISFIAILEDGGEGQEIVCFCLYISDIPSTVLLF